MPCTFKKFIILSEHDDLPISVLLAMPDTPIRGIVQLAHDMAEHKGRYKPFMSYLCEYGYACIINDHRGHGKSVLEKADLGYFYEGRAAALVQDMYQVMHFAKKQWPDVPLCLFGYSMGALAARIFAKSYDVQLNALVLCGSPSYNEKIDKAVRRIRMVERLRGDRHKSSFFDRIFFREFERSFPKEMMPFAWLNSDYDAVEEYLNDPLCGFSFTLNGYLSLLDMAKSAYSSKGWGLKNAILPIRFISGEHDPCMINRDKLNSAIQSMYDVGYENVDLLLYPGMRHDILHERQHQKVYDDIVNWLDKVMPS